WYPELGRGSARNALAVLWNTTDCFDCFVMRPACSLVPRESQLSMPLSAVKVRQCAMCVYVSESVLCTHALYTHICVCVCVCVWVCVCVCARAYALCT